MQFVMPAPNLHTFNQMQTSNPKYNIDNGTCQSTDKANPKPPPPHTYDACTDTSKWAMDHAISCPMLHFLCVKSVSCHIHMLYP